MPYNPDSVENLPKNVQDMNDSDRKMWCDIWNKTHDKYGDEEKAFKYANGVLKKRAQGKGLFDFDAPWAKNEDIDLLWEYEVSEFLQNMDIETKIAKDLGIEVQII